MNSPQPETKITSGFVLSFIYSAASIKASVWGGGSLSDGLTTTSMVVSSVDAAAASLSLKRRRDLYPKVFEGADWAGGGASEVDTAWGRVTWALCISFSSYFFLYSLRSLSFEALRCTEIWLLYNSMISIEHWWTSMFFYHRVSIIPWNSDLILW